MTGDSRVDRDRLYLGHLLSAIADIEDFASAGQEEFMRDRKTQSAVIRQLEVLGEAVKQLSDPLRAAHPEVPWRLIAGARDRLIHGYFQVDLGSVWAMVAVDLPVLKRQIRSIVDDV